MRRLPVKRLYWIIFGMFPKKKKKNRNGLGHYLVRSTSVLLERSSTYMRRFMEGDKAFIIRLLFFFFFFCALN